MKVCISILLFLAGNWCLAQKTVGEVVEAAFQKQTKAEQTKQKETAKDEKKEDLKSQNVGNTSFASGLESTIKDFAPLWSGVIDGYESAKDGKSFTLDFNIPTGLENSIGKVKLQAVLTEPKLSEPIKKLFPKDTRSSLAESIEEDFNDTDDITWKLTANVERKNIGRTYNRYNLDLFESIWDSVFVATNKKAMDGAFALAEWKDYNFLMAKLDPDKVEEFEKAAWSLVSNKSKIDDLLFFHEFKEEALTTLLYPAGTNGHRAFKADSSADLRIQMQRNYESFDYKGDRKSDWKAFVDEVVAIYKSSKGERNKTIPKAVIKEIVVSFELKPESLDDLWQKDGEELSFKAPDASSNTLLINRLSEDLMPDDEARQAAFRSGLQTLFRQYREHNRFEAEPGSIPLKFLSKEAVAELNKLAKDVVTEELAIDQAIYDAMKVHRIDNFTALVNNQPQFSLTLDYAAPDKLIGQSGTSVKATYELPLTHNVNGLREKLDDPKYWETEDEGVEGERTKHLTQDGLTAYTNYVKAPDFGRRLSFELELEEKEEHQVVLEELAEPYIFADDNRGILKVGYGQYLHVSDENKGLDRFDIKAAWEHYWEREEKKNRFIAALTYTPKSGKLVSFPITLKYANRGEYLVETDAEFSTHFGIAFKSAK